MKRTIKKSIISVAVGVLFALLYATLFPELEEQQRMLGSDTPWIYSPVGTGLITGCLTAAILLGLLARRSKKCGGTDANGTLGPAQNSAPGPQDPGHNGMQRATLRVLKVAAGIA